MQQKAVVRRGNLDIISTYLREKSDVITRACCKSELLAKVQSGDYSSENGEASVSAKAGNGVLTK